MLKSYGIPPFQRQPPSPSESLVRTIVATTVFTSLLPPLHQPYNLIWKFLAAAIGRNPTCMLMYHSET